jgi:ERCC4-related helicase
MSFIHLEFIKENKVEKRDYQDRLSDICLRQNCLIIAPTGLGKTIIAALFIAKSLIEDQNRRFLLIAPTRVLVGQHTATLRDVLSLDLETIAEVTGEDSIEKRIDRWKKQIVVATSEITISDLDKGIFKPEEFYSVIFDEAHHAIGNHPYTLLSSSVHIRKPDIRIIGFTASPPSEKESQEEVLNKLNINHVEVITENSPEVKKYFLGSEMEIIKIKPTPALLKIRQDLLTTIQRIRENLGKKGVLGNVGTMSLKKLIELEKKDLGYEERSQITSLIRLYHCLDIAESYGIEPFIIFCEKIFLKRGKSATNLREDLNFKAAYETAKSMLIVREEHPKVLELKKILKNKSEGDRVIIFSNYKDTIKMLYEKALLWGLNADYLIGKRGEFSQSQKKQLETLNKMNKGEKNILFATRVGEEGLDIIECNLVIFYDSISDAVRFIQRKGRTGRKKKGRVIVLIMEGTKEEVLFWIGKKRIEKGREIIKKSKVVQNTVPLERFINGKNQGVKIIVDTRENMVIKTKLNNLNIYVEEQMLDVGDFVLSEDVCVERKTLKDFASSIIDGRLFPQLIQLKQKYNKPILILEKGPQSDRISQNAFLGALASIITDFNIALIITESTEESAALMYVIAKREQIEKKKSIKVREGEKPVSIKEIQKYILAGMPGVSAILATRLLEKFGTLQNVFNASENELFDVKGIGDVMAKRIKEITTADFNKGQIRYNE